LKNEPRSLIFKADSALIELSLKSLSGVTLINDYRKICLYQRYSIDVVCITPVVEVWTKAKIIYTSLYRFLTILYVLESFRVGEWSSLK